MVSFYILGPKFTYSMRFSNILIFRFYVSSWPFFYFVGYGSVKLLPRRILIFLSYILMAYFWIRSYYYRIRILQDPDPTHFFAELFLLLRQIFRFIRVHRDLSRDLTRVVCQNSPNAAVCMNGCGSGSSSCGRIRNSKKAWIRVLV